MNTPHKSSVSDIRRTFLEFFKSKGHEIVASSPLVPGNDPTLLFTNAGMVQFKDVFLGAEKRSYKRAVSSQRCVRAGGKHNDLDQVGYTARHHTFFEMLGNFSFGDYFKRDAIAYAWELLTKVYGLPAEKLWVTVYHTDDEAYEIWNRDIGIPADRIVRIGDNKGAPFASDNFWQMADTGPCGPCTEIFYDHGAEIPGGPPGSPDEDGDRYIEIWNNVFMQFDRSADGTLTPLPAPCVDTGMGLERLAAVLQHVHSNYEIDLFANLIKAAGEFTGTVDLENKSLRVIADHIRACAFLIVDGVLPSNEGRGYVLRRIIRRALRHGWKLGAKNLFFHRMVAPLVAEMGDAYPELKAKQQTVAATLKAEEERFAETLEQGMRVFDTEVAKLGTAASKQIPGEVLFRLYDTYGFPVDLTADIARERGIDIDREGFERAMEQQRERARAASQFGGQASLSADVIKSLSPTEFFGYDELVGEDLPIAAIVRDGASVPELNAGEQGMVVLARTPFYAESGGQVGDRGELIANGLVFQVDDTHKLAGTFHGHVGKLANGTVKVGDKVRAIVDGERRRSTVLNHSATHLLHAALRKTLGEHVQQKGSLVAPDRLRFDFSHFQAMTPQELSVVEAQVNDEIRRNAPAEVHQMSYPEALEFGAIALFGEKYGEHVRVLRMGDFSTELCGGTHVSRTGDIGVFKILSESGVAAGVRRIEAVTGAAALAHIAGEEATLAQIARLLAASQNEVVDKLTQLFARQKQLERELESFRMKAASSALDDALAKAVDVGGIKVLATRLGSMDTKGLRDALDAARQKLGDCVVVLAGAADGKASIVAGVAGSALGRVKAGDVVSHIAAKIGGRGGGRPDMAQGGGEDSPALDAALAEIATLVSSKIAGE